MKNYIFYISVGLFLFGLNQIAMQAQNAGKFNIESANIAEYPLLITTTNSLVRTNNWGQFHLQNTNASVSNFWHLGHRDDNSFDIAYGQETGNVIPKFNAKLSILPSGLVGIGTGSPTSMLHVAGDALIQGNLMINGTLSGAQIDVSQITGLLGQGYSAVFPDVLDNTVDLEIEGLISNKVLIYSTVGFETERISTPTMDGKSTENVGLTMEFPLEFETSDAGYINALKTWFDDASPLPKGAQIIIKQLNGVETARWTFLSYLPDGYEPGNDGRTRFKIIHSKLPNSNLETTYNADFGSALSFNPVTDRRVEISGVNMGYPCTPKVEVNTTVRTVTLTFEYNEGFQLLNWVESTVAGNEPDPKSMSIIETTNGTDELSRLDYLEVRPIKYEHIYGFGLNTKLQARVVLAYGNTMVPP